MANDLSDTVRDALGHVVRDALKNMSGAAPTPKNGNSRLTGMKGLAAGAGLAAAAPLAKKGVDAMRGNGGVPTPARAVSKVASKAGDKVGGRVKEAVSGKVDEAGGAGGIAKKAASGLLPGIGDDSDSGGNDGMPGVGKGRRMPIQQSVDVAVPVETAYNQWTQFEDWPEFMHRVTRVTQEDEPTVKFATKIWGKTKEFTAKIETQRPDERIKWRVSEGITHTGVLTFHELAPRLTRIELTMDVDPGSLIEKAARGMRHIKRAVRADLHRYKAFIEVQETETGAWRGLIEDGEVVEDHDESYDEGRDYSEVEDIYEEPSSDDEDSDEQDEDQDDRRQRQSRSRRSSGGGRSRSQSSSSGSRSSGSRSRSRGATNGRSSSGGRKSSSRTAAASRSSSSRSPSSQSKPSSSKSSSSGSSKSSKSGGSGNSKTSARSGKSSSGKSSSGKSSSGKSSSGGRRRASSRS